MKRNKIIIGSRASKLALIYADKAREEISKYFTGEIIIEKINLQQTKTIRGSYALEVYEQVAKLALFSYETFIAISNFDKGENDPSLLLNKMEEFTLIRDNFEKVYAKSRNIIKPDNYILDQDHHNHTANQTLNMDWQFIAEIKLFEKINLTYN